MTSHPFLHGTSNRHNNRIPSPRCLPVTVVIIVLRGSNAAIEMESDCKMKCTKETECRSLANQRREERNAVLCRCWCRRCQVPVGVLPAAVDAVHEMQLKTYPEK